MMHSDLLRDKRTTLHLMLLTEVLLLHPGILQLEEFGVLSVYGKRIVMYFLTLPSSFSRFPETILYRWSQCHLVDMPVLGISVPQPRVV